MNALTEPLNALDITRLLTWRRHLHAEPELSFEEHDTQQYVREALAEMGLTDVTEVGGTGLVATLGRGEDPRVLLVRADMDALPVQEQSGLPFASRRPGVMHACGHDAHTASLLAVAARLIAHQHEIPGTVVLCFQPGEELGQGARRMIDAGLLTGRWRGPDAPPLHVDRALGLHVWSGLPVGTISCATGPVMAAVDDFEVHVRGRGGHGALPQHTRDAILASCGVVQALQQIASRRVDPLDPVVVTVGSFHGGTAANVIADEVVLQGTVRSYSKELADLLPGLFVQTAQDAALAWGCSAEVEYIRYCISTVNHPEMAELVASAAAKIRGVQTVDRNLRMMAGEDMSFLLDAVPGCFFFVGCGAADGSSEPHHSPRFLVDEAALPLGAQVMLQAVVDYFAS